MRTICSNKTKNFCLTYCLACYIREERCLFGTETNKYGISFRNKISFPKSSKRKSFNALQKKKTKKNFYCFEMGNFSLSLSPLFTSKTKCEYKANTSRS